VDNKPAARGEAKEKNIGRKVDATTGSAPGTTEFRQSERGEKKLCKNNTLFKNG